ncbi:unnamed protein product [Blepharisma stoltei]|uniref:Cyclin N-terminal domain-containing protein n=1 Tax=Blepharisma stoltei TaxID=1481888 RepID=A0AAU9J6N7_9CILI|nr:unnamed protein product [Blepharisma stoltei]
MQQVQRTRRHGILDLNQDLFKKLWHADIKTSETEHSPDLESYQSNDDSAHKSRRLSYKDKIRVAQTAEEKLFLKKALDFLSNIRTGQELVQQNELNRNRAKLRIQRKSYRKFLNDYSPDKYPSVDLSDAPMCMPPSQMTDALNYEFQIKNPQLGAGLTLSKIVNLQYNLIQVLCKDLDIDVWTLAMAFRYFHRLLCVGVVTRQNRKLVAYTCVVLAYKFNEEIHLNLSKLRLQVLVRAMCDLDKKNNLKPSDIFEYEFEAYRKLRFNLNCDASEFEEYFYKILEKLEIDPEKYLGDENKWNDVN